MAADSVGTFVQRVLGEMAVHYVNIYVLGGKVKHMYLITRQICMVLYQ